MSVKRYEIESLQKLEVRNMLDCRLNVISTLLKLYGITVNPNLLLLCSKKYGFTYMKTSLSDFGDLKLYLGGTSSFEVEKDILEAMSIPYEKANLNPSCLDDYIDKVKNQQVILYGYDSRFIIDDNYQEKKNKLLNLYSLSLTLIGGCDLESKEFDIIFQNEDECTQLRKVPMDKFLQSRVANTYPIRPFEVTYELKIKNEESQFYQDKIYDIQTRGLKKIIKNMLYGAYEEDHIFDGTKAIGMQALYDFYNDLVNDRNICANEDDKKFVIKFSILKEMCIHGSYTCYRQEFGEALSLYNKLYLNKDINSIKEYINEASIVWRSMVRQLFSVSKYMKEKEIFYNKIIDYVDKIINLERAYFNELEKIIPI